VSKCARAITASRSGFGMSLRFVLPSAASVNIVSISDQLEGWPHLDGETNVLVAGVREAVHRARRHDGDVARNGDELLVADSQVQPPFQHLEAFGLIWGGGVRPRRSRSRAGAL